jgi:hypothetical protein
MTNVSFHLRRWLLVAGRPSPPFRLTKTESINLLDDRRKMIYAPSMTTVTLSAIPLAPSSTVCTTLSTCAVAIRASSCANLSSLFSESSMSVLPTSFFIYFSKHPRSTVAHFDRDDSLVLPCFISFVAIPRIESTSTMICMMISIISGVGGTLV